MQKIFLVGLIFLFSNLISAQCEYPLITIKLNEVPYHEIQGIQLTCGEFYSDTSYINFTNWVFNDTPWGGCTVPYEERVRFLNWIDEFVKQRGDIERNANEFFEIHIYISDHELRSFVNFSKSDFVDFKKFISTKAVESPDLVDYLLYTFNIYRIGHNGLGE